MVSNHGSALFLKSPHYFKGALFNMVVLNLILISNFPFLLNSGIIHYNDFVYLCAYICAL